METGILPAIPDDTQVYIGKFNEDHLEVSAARSVGIARVHDAPLGLEVILPRKVSPSEIISIYSLPKMTGWRYAPNAKGNKPCPCDYCQRGEPYSAKIKKKK